MNQAANVTSIEAIHAFRAALVKFEESALDSIVALELEIRRAVDWIEVDRRRYWPAQVKKASDELAQARNALERCQLKYGSEEAPPCYEQKKEYERAKQRLRYCEDQVRNVKRWMQIIRQELTVFDGQLAKMRLSVDSELPRAISTLSSLLNALERYTGATNRVQPRPPSNDLEVGDVTQESDS
ncbi:MAG: hypothetical protein H6822_02955 [Planctomycetaceae bacterium]|nr:hypothetical protein [Planctomycetales bacterium]MCB9921111.1 hypothetical protein [Planctomycetaceae bacterium]